MHQSGGTVLSNVVDRDDKAPEWTRGFEANQGWWSPKLKDDDDDRYKRSARRGQGPFPYALRRARLVDNCGALLIANGYEAIPVKYCDKAPIGARWQTEPISTDRFAAALKEHGAVNVGCRCGKLVALDIDVFEGHPKFREIVAPSGKGY